jgi:hypothetical protein
MVTVCYVVAILAGFSSVILVMLPGQSRVFFMQWVKMDCQKHLEILHPKMAKTPYKHL